MVACKDNNQCQGCKVGMHKVRLGFPEFKKPSDSDSMNFKISDWIWTQKVQFKLPVFLGVLLFFWLLPNWLPDSAILIYMVANNHFLWKKIELWQFIKHSTECVLIKDLICLFWWHINSFCVDCLMPRHDEGREKFIPFFNSIRAW